MKKSTASLVKFYQRLKARKAKVLEDAEKKEIKAAKKAAREKVWIEPEEKEILPFKKIRITPEHYKEGIKFHPNNLDKVYEKYHRHTGKKCKRSDCETMTERYDGFCPRHQLWSKSKKYTIEIPRTHYDEEKLKHVPDS